MLTVIQDAAQLRRVLEETELVLVDLTASWCPPCQMLEPTLHKLSDEWVAGRIVQVDVDTLPAVAQQMHVDRMPTLILFERGAEVQRQHGALPESQLRTLLGLPAAPSSLWGVGALLAGVALCGWLAYLAA